VLRFEVLTTVNMESKMFWYVTPCSLVEADSACRFLVACLIHSLALNMQAVRPSETSVDSARLHGTISQMILPFNTSKPDRCNAVRLYSVGAWFEFRRAHRLCTLRFIVIFLSPSRKIPKYYLN
jgi:hypothetical protein